MSSAPANVIVMNVMAPGFLKTDGDLDAQKEHTLFGCDLYLTEADLALPFDDFMHNLARPVMRMLYDYMVPGNLAREIAADKTLLEADRAARLSAASA